jgi:hypothetical protein
MDSRLSVLLKRSLELRVLASFGLRYCERQSLMSFWSNSRSSDSSSYAANSPSGATRAGGPSLT